QAAAAKPAPPTPAPSPEPAVPPQEASARPQPVRSREPEPQPYVSISAEPVSSSFLGRVVHKIPLIRRFKKPAQPFVPPKPVRQVRPELTAQEQRTLTAETPISVKVYVNESGKVDYAELLSGDSQKNRSL